MDFELRLATLSKLLDNPSAPVQQRLGEELRRVEGILDQSTDYDELDGALKILAVLAPKFHGAVLPVLVKFVRSVPTRVLTQSGEPIGADRQRYRSASQLIREAIEVPSAIRYIHTAEVVSFLLELSRSSDKEVKNKAESQLENLAEFNLHHFNTLGAGPQKVIVEQLAKLDDDDLVLNAVAALRVLSAVLSSSMEGHTSSYQTITISRGSVPSGAGVAEMRADALALLKRMYPLRPAVAYRKSVLSVINSAARREQQSYDAESKRMLDRDALEVLGFMRELVATEALPLVQTIEHDCYWNYVHAASSEIEVAALAVRDELALRSDYQIYKQLIGFEGIFGQWEKLRAHEEAWDYSNTKRQEAVRGYIESINADNMPEWRDRILEFSKTESDDLATFPVFYEFLELLGRQKPDLALELITAHKERMRPFLIPIVSGLYASERKADIVEIVQRWLAEGSHLIAIAKSLFKNGAEQLDILSATVARAAQLDDRDALSVAMGVATHLYANGNAAAKAVFMESLRALALHNDSRWARAFWYGKDFKVLAAGMNAQERGEILSSLASSPELDYQTEELLRTLGEHDADAVFSFLSDRLSVEAQDRAQRRAEGRGVLDDNFEAIPYHLHGLNKLLERNPETLIALLRQSFGEKEARLMFPYRGGARLVKAVYPNFEPQLQVLLMKLVETRNERDIEFVTAVVRSYGGSAPILEVCKAIIKVVPERSSTWNELAAAMETTGVVSGEYGLVHAYERKRDELAAWKTDESDQVRAFAEWITEQLERMITSEQQRADEGLALRKYQYGVNSDEA